MRDGLGVQLRNGMHWLVFNTIARKLGKWREPQKYG